jgi:xanthine dehydrogenase accessory factor
MDHAALLERMSALARQGVPSTLVILVEALGSTPQDAGAKMLVTAQGLEAGTVGGGKVEAKAIAFAQELLAQAGARPRLVNWVLKRDGGMTCGESVKLYFEARGGAGGAD